MTSTDAHIPGTARRLSRFEFSMISITAAGLALLLNHSMIAGGFNLSLADGLLVVMLLLLLATSRLYLMRYALLFFIVLLAIAASTTLWLTPLIFGVSAEPRAVVGDMVKLTISFLYFLVGVSVARLGLEGLVLKWFALGATAVAAVAVGMEVVGVRMLEGTLYYDATRFRGLMSDPNFYSILACSALAYFAYTTRFSLLLRLAAAALLVLSVLLSGSKTGLITLVLLLLIVLVTSIIHSKNIGAPMLLISLTVGGVALLMASWGSFLRLVYRLSLSFPQLERVSLLLSGNFSEVLSGDGSTREIIWSTGLHIIQSSPVFGVGFGAYTSVGDSRYGQPDVAHNTYIQLAAEWGLVLALCLFSWIAVLLVRASLHGKPKGDAQNFLILREITFVFLIGSLSLSLNNARMLWFFLGLLSLMCYLRTRETSRQEKTPASRATPVSLAPAGEK